MSDIRRLDVMSEFRRIISDVFSMELPTKITRRISVGNLTAGSPLEIPTDYRQVIRFQCSRIDGFVHCFLLFSYSNTPTYVSTYVSTYKFIHLYTLTYELKIKLQNSATELR